MRGRRVEGKCLILILIFAFLVLGCRQQAAAGQADIVRVVVILPHSDDGYWRVIESAIEDREAEAFDAGVDIQIQIPQLNYNISQMTDILKQAILAQVDVIVVQGNEDAEFTKQLRKAYDSGIKVICVDTDLVDFPDHLYIGTDNYRAGQMLGEKLLDLSGAEEGDGKLSAVIISGEEGYPNLEDRVRGFEDAVKPSGDVEVQDILYDHYDAITFMKLFNSVEGVDAVIFVEGTAAQTLGRMTDSRDDKFRYILGTDMEDPVNKGVMDGVVLQNMKQMGDTVVDRLISWKEQGTELTGNICTDIQWYGTKDVPTETEKIPAGTEETEQ